MKCEISTSGDLQKAIVFLRKGWALIIIIAVSGCAVYHPMPITPEAVRARLQPPDMAELRILAGKISHPILHPLKIKPGKGLSPDGAAVLAVLLNPSLRAVRDQRALSKAQLLEAGLLPNPRLDYSLDVPTGANTTDKINAYGLGLTYEVTSLISRAVRINKAKAHRKAVDLDIAWREWQIAQAARAAVYQLAALRNQITLTEEARRHMSQYLARIHKAVAAGSLRAQVLNSAQTASSHINTSLLDLKKQADQYRLRLMRLIGLPAATQLRLSKDINLPSQVKTPAVARLIKGLEQRRLDLIALRRGYESQEEAVRAAVMEQFPRLSIGPTFNSDTDNLKTTGFGLNIELPVFNHAQGKIARQRATRQRLFDEYVNRVFKAHSDIELLISKICFTNEQITAASAMRAKLSRRLKNYRAALTAGRTDAQTCYTVWSALVSARMKLAVLKGKLMQAVTALQLATGFYKIPPPSQAPASAPTKFTKGGTT